MKALLAIVVLGGLGYLAYAKVLRPAPVRACDRIAALCEQKLEGKDLEQCKDGFEQLAKRSPDDKTTECVLDAKSCSEAIGCTAGGVMKLGIGAAADFMHGLDKASK